ncbi:DUF3016 domain-containing protein [Shewanella chilikensis]|uniref:DUF3016 domain-containing protein n=1 Tax=Shewanella chilikensis TaxID=558541 RepID=UPI001F379481|nr:DUF3016 domain-containing protein [Shewanella chilikensis]MCE9787641.1 DUF3016 domain-containing protein [Shewanella chilikensis]
MKIRHLLLVSALASGSVLAADKADENPVTESGKVKIEWQSPKNFRDIESAGELQSRYEKRLFDTLTKALDKDVSSSLKDNQKLELTVTDVDLAGDVRPTFGATANDIRVVKNVYPPKISFSYRLLDGDQLIIAGDEKLTDMQFLDHVDRINSDSFRYEERMLKDWFQKTLKPKL